VRILIVGYDTPGALERHCALPLREMGHTVRFHDVHTYIVAPARLAHFPAVNKVEIKLLSGPFNRDLLAVTRQWHPDLVMVFKGAEVHPDTLCKLHTIPNRPVLVNWNPDSPFDYRTMNTSSWLVTSIPLYDAYFIWGREVIQPLLEAGAQRVEYLPFGYDPKTHCPVKLTTAERDALRSQVCFVGGYTTERVALLEALAGVDVRIWGTGWDRLAKESPLRACVMGGWTHGLAMSQVFSAADVVMNFVRPQNGQAHNMRTFEAPAIGAFMLATRTHEQMGWLPEDEAAAYFVDESEMCNKVAHYLGRPAERAQIAAEGHRRITSGNHTYGDRMHQLMSVVETL
jgi:spore maturation protein CgeB